MKSYGRALAAQLTGPGAVFLLSCTATAIAVTATLFLWVEREANPLVKSWFDALYMTINTMTGVGYGDIVPVTTGGRTIAMLAMLGGTALFAAYTALVASAILEVGRDARWRNSRRRS